MYRYSIDVNDADVTIYGSLTFEEAYDFLSFFERKGYDSLSTSAMDNNCCMYFSKKSKDIKKEQNDDDSLYKNLYEFKSSKNIELENKIIELEDLIKKLIDRENSEKNE